MDDKRDLSHESLIRLLDAKYAHTYIDVSHLVGGPKTSEGEEAENEDPSNNKNPG